MYSIDILIGTGLCALIVGGLLGMLFGRNSTAGSQQARELEKRIDQLTRDKQAYENRVTEHFVETADRLNALTDMYRGIHEHLAEGASTLCVGKNDVSVKRLASAVDDGEVPQEALNIEPPRDYAPKAEGETGMLNESFGIERESTPGTRQGVADTEEAEDVVEESSAGTVRHETEAAADSEAAAETETAAETGTTADTETTAETETAAETDSERKANA
jgi:hypothetical protein